MNPDVLNSAIERVSAPLPTPPSRPPPRPLPRPSDNFTRQPDRIVVAIARSVARLFIRVSHIQVVLPRNKAQRVDGLVRGPDYFIGVTTSWLCRLIGELHQQSREWQCGSITVLQALEERSEHGDRRWRNFEWRTARV